MGDVVPVAQDLLIDKDHSGRPRGAVHPEPGIYSNRFENISK